ncbi:MAG: acyl carrier protein [Candidatus Izemoplasmatales bacterium]
MKNVKEFILDYLQREYTIPDDIDILSLNYIESGYIDSLAMIQFIATLEDEFNITFTDDDLVNPDIKVVGKLIKLVESKLNK